jgi:hypothetical protein
MANTLLDFVMSLVRDPDAAARYAADPAGAIADAHLPDVTSADVNNLIPMVADSLNGPVSAGGFGPSAGGGGDGNVWASGAATAAFDAFNAFDAHLPAAVSDAQPVITDIAQHAGLDPAVITDPAFDSAIVDLPDSSTQVTDVGFEHAADVTAVDAGVDWVDHTAFDHGHVDDTHGTVDPGFDLF